MLQAQRRHDPYPLTWEVPAGAVTVLFMLAVLGVHLGRGLANWTAGSGWAWPTGRALFASIPAVLTGHAAAGLDPPPGTPAPAGTVIGWIIAVEIVLLLTTTVAAVALLRQWGPGRMRGMASRDEADTTLGVARLRRNRSLIRPDLYLPGRGPRRERRLTPAGPEADQVSSRPLVPDPPLPASRTPRRPAHP